VFPDERESVAIGKRLSAVGPKYKFVSVHGQPARDLLAAGGELIDALGNNAWDVREGKSIPQRDVFSEAARCGLPSVEDGARYLIVSPSTVPLDLACDESGSWGDRAIFSHLCVPQAPSEGLLARAVLPRAFPLEGYLLVCPMRMDRLVPRHLQDIVTVALSFESSMPVELWLQPRYDRALQALSRTDLSWLHIDTHGTRTRIMLGPTREGQQMAGASELPTRVFTPLVIVVGCALLSGSDGIGAVLFRRGAEAVFGPCAVFHSLGVANSEDGEAAWYRTLFESLLRGADLGVSLLHARQSVTGSGILKHAYLIAGSSYVRFVAAGDEI
jgi:hypothetical protein